MDSNNFTLTASTPGSTLYTTTGPNGYNQSNDSGIFAISSLGSYTISASNGSPGCEATTVKNGLLKLWAYLFGGFRFAIWVDSYLRTWLVIGG